MKGLNVIACLLCPKDADGYYPEFEGETAGAQFAAHLAATHGYAAQTPVARELTLHLSAAKVYQSNYWLYEQTPAGRGRRIGAQRVETPRRGGR
ncbi:MAG TPA: hypothetical protein PKD53_00495 [Chloroflexaceae bacterium]|nr:hypothetical protein [Chloroflexaceae bacterium]